MMIARGAEDSLVTLVEETISELESLENKNQDDQSCPQYFGYLAVIPSHSLIPEECLLCSKVIKCVIHSEKISQTKKDQ